MFYAEIKKASRHASQRSYHLDEKGKFIPFPVEVTSFGVACGQGAVKGGVGGNYDLNEVILYVKNDFDAFVKVK